MGIPLGGVADVANIAQTTVLAAVGDATPWFYFDGTCNIAVIAGAGTTGSIEVERSFDGGATPLRASNLGVVPAIPAGCSEVLFSRENGLLHRARRISGTGATFSVRFSQ